MDYKVQKNLGTMEKGEGIWVSFLKKKQKKNQKTEALKWVFKVQ